MTPEEAKNLFKHVRTKEGARKIWKDNNLSLFVKTHEQGKGFYNFMVHHIPWRIKENRKIDNERKRKERADSV